MGCSVSRPSSTRLQWRRSSSRERYRIHRRTLSARPLNRLWSSLRRHSNVLVSFCSPEQKTHLGVRDVGDELSEGPHIGCWPKSVVLGRHSIGRFEKITLSDCIELLQFSEMKGFADCPRAYDAVSKQPIITLIVLHAALPGSMVAISQRDGKHALPACRLSFA